MLAASPAWATPPLPDYAEEVTVAAWTEINHRIERACTWAVQGAPAPTRCDTEALDAAAIRARAYERHVQPDARIRYLQGLALRLKGDARSAERVLTEAAALNDQRREIWFDLGELRMARGDYPGAAEAFERVTALLPDGPGAWIAWFQLAQIAGHRRDPEAMADALRQALRHGLSLRTIQAQPAWRAFFADPALREVITRMVTLYGDPGILDSLRADDAK